MNDEILRDDGMEDANVNVDDNIQNEHDNIPSSDEKVEIPTMKVIPLKKICMTIGQLPTAYIETMSYYEMLVWFIEFLRNNVIPTVNNNGEAVNELQTIVMTLQNYINTYKQTIDEEMNNFQESVNNDILELEDYMNNYFNNLDVQEEINNKLDQMLEDGVLEQIIEQFLQLTSLLCFDNVADMKSSVNLTNGSFAKTLGYYSKNDGGGSTYKIRTITNSDVVDEMFIIALNDENIIAELIIENDTLNLLQVGAKKDETADVGSIINSVITKGFTNIFIPKGNYLINTPINLNDCVGVNIVGEMFGTYKNSSVNATKLIGNTGNDAIIKMIGAEHICLEKLCLLSTDDTENPSTLGILQGCSTSHQFSQWINLTNIQINLISSDTANSNNGSIGIYNWQSELNSYLNVFSYADIPVYLTRDDELGIAYANGAILPVHDSLTGNNYTNLETQSKKEYTICIGGDSLTFTGFYGQGTVKFLTNTRGDYQTNNIFIQGVIEKNEENTIGATFEITPQVKLQKSFISVTSVDHAVAFYCTTAGQVISNSYINISGNFSSGNLADTKIRFNNNIIYKGTLLINNAYSQGNIIFGGPLSKATANSNLSLLNDGIIYSDGVGFGFSNDKPTRTDLPNNSTIINTGNTSFVGWRYKSSSSSWIPIGIGTPLESDTGTIPSYTPLYVGQLLHNVSDNSMWMGYATTQGAWKQITN